MEVAKKRSTLDQLVGSGFTSVPNGILLGMPWLSDPGHRTYGLLLALKWSDQAQGIWHAKEKLASLWDRPLRTLQDGLAELEHFDLIERELRPPSTSLIRLKDVPPVALLYAEHKIALLTGPRDVWPKDGKADERCQVSFVHWLQLMGYRSELRAWKSLEAKQASWRARRQRRSAEKGEAGE